MAPSRKGGWGNTLAGPNPASSAMEGTHPVVHPVPKTGGGLAAVGLDTSSFLRWPLPNR